MNTLQADLSILWPALIAGFIVVLSHVPLGQQVLSRGIVFIDLAIAQVAGVGVIAAHTFGFGASDPFSQVIISDRAIHDTIASMVVHGVFDRHPSLRVASIENGSPTGQESIASSVADWITDS